ncbi:MAG: hypothetical protein K2H04_09755 [Bacteroidaceae bacterium]|nr:hypothetical protein [Bacteroidaceae bacterium]
MGTETYGTGWHRSGQFHHTADQTRTPNVSGSLRLCPAEGVGMVGV